MNNYNLSTTVTGTGPGLWPPNKDECMMAALPLQKMDFGCIALRGFEY